MTPKTAVVSAFVLGAIVGAVATWTVSPQAAEPKRLSTSDIVDFDMRVRAIVERCLIVGAGTSLAHITCHFDGL